MKRRTGSRAQFKIATGLVFPLYTYSQKFYFKQSDITISIKCSNQDYAQITMTANFTFQYEDLRFKPRNEKKAIQLLQL